MKQKLIILFLLLIVAISSLAQGSEQNKYWFYRYRLRHKIMKAGLTDYSCSNISQDNFMSGYSIPASIINYGDDKLVWGDGTVELGWYIGILVTEWKLLKDNTEKKVMIIGLNAKGRTVKFTVI